jgi:L-arabinose isomerase
MAPASEPTQVSATASLLPNVEVLVPSPAVEVQGPPPTTEVAESYSVRVALTAEEMMELATCRYIDFPGVGVIDLEVPQLLEKGYEVAAERMFNEPTIMEMIASVSKALQEYERAGGFASAVATDAEDVALAAHAARVEPTLDASVPPQVNEGRKASPP